MCSSLNLWRWNHGCEGPTMGLKHLGICRGPWNQSPVDTEGQLHRLMSVLLEKHWVGQKVHYRKTQTNSLANPIKLRLEFGRQDLPPYFYLVLGQSLIK